MINKHLKRLKLRMLFFPSVWVFYQIWIALHSEVMNHPRPQLRFPYVSCTFPKSARVPPNQHCWPLSQRSSFVPLKYYLFSLWRPCQQLPWQPSVRDYSASSDKSKGMLTWETGLFSDSSPSQTFFFLLFSNKCKCTAWVCIIFFY